MNSEQFYLSHEEIKAEPYHYTVCGLTNIYLANGFTIDEYDGQEIVAVKDVDGLHKAIGRHLVVHRKGLAPDEVRFLRKTLDMTQAELGKALGCDSQSVARWEKGVCAIPAATEKLLRAYFFANNLNSDAELPLLKALIASALGELDDMDEWPEQAEFRFCNRWEEPDRLAA